MCTDELCRTEIIYRETIQQLNVVRFGYLTTHKLMLPYLILMEMSYFLGLLRGEIINQVNGLVGQYNVVAQILTEYFRHFIMRQLLTDYLMM